MNLAGLEKKLPELLGKFNPFRILKIEDYEIRHSNVIAWLLDPKESHGLGTEILSKFIKIVKKDVRDNLSENKYPQLHNLNSKDLHKQGKASVCIDRSMEGAQNHSMIMTILQTAKLNGIDPLTTLEKILLRSPQNPLAKAPPP